jgi:hypothetical protein
VEEKARRGIRVQREVAGERTRRAAEELRCNMAVVVLVAVVVSLEVELFITNQC